MGEGIGTNGTVRTVRVGLRLRFLGIMLGLAVVPLIILPAVLAGRAHGSLEQQSIQLQSEVAHGVSVALQSTLTGRASELAMLDDVSGLRTAEPARQRILMANLLAGQRMFQDLALLDADGQEQIRVARDNVVLGSDLRDRADDEPYIQVVESRATYFGPVRFDEVAREPLMTIARPLVDPLTGLMDGVIVADVRFKPVWDLLAGLDLADGHDVFLVDADGMVIAHRNPALVLSVTNFTAPSEPGRAIGLSGEEAVITTERLTFGEQELVVVAEQPVDVAFRLAEEAVGTTAVLVIIAAIAAVAGIVLITRRFIVPVEKMAVAARKVAGGDLRQRVEEGPSDEVGQLADAFNEMTSQLQAIVGSLEQRVSERTEELEQAAAVQRELITDLESNNAELARIQEELERLLKSKDEFLGSVSHELRTPLTSVVGFATELRDHQTEFDAQERREMIAMIAAQGEDMANIINDLLVAARADSNGLIIKPVHLDISAEIHAVVDQQPGIVTRLDLPNPPVKVFADATRVRQVLRNLVANAARYGGSEVEVSAAADGECVVVQVRDNGSGIPPHEWESIFDPYTRSHDREGQPASVGLGLTVSRILARRMEGDLVYRYERDQSVFELLLPANDTSDAAHDPADAAPQSLAGYRPQ